MSLVWRVSVFWVCISHKALTYVALQYFDLSSWKINLIVSVPACSLQTWDRRPSSFHIKNFHTDASIFTKYVYPRTFTVVSQWVWCATSITVILFFFGVYFITIVWDYMYFCCVCHIHFEDWRWILECCHMVDSWPGIIFVCASSCRYNVIFPCVFSSDIKWGSGTDVSNFIFSNPIFGYLSIFGVTVKSWLLIGWTKSIFLLGLLVGVHMGMPL